MLVAASFVLYFVARAYLRSEGFRDLVTLETTKVLRSKGDFDQFNWVGTSVYSDGFEARGYKDASFSWMKADGLRARFNLAGIRSRLWDITEIQVDKILMTISSKRLEKKAPAPPPSGSDGKGKGGGFLAGLLPNRVLIRETSVKSLNFMVRDESGEELVIGSGIRVRVAPSPYSNQAWEIDAKGGKLNPRAERLPDLLLEDAHATLRDEKLECSRAMVRLWDGATVTASGKAVLGDVPDIDMDFKLESLPCDKLLPGNLKDKILGSVHGKVNVKGNPEQFESLVQTGNLEIRDGRLEGLALLKTLHKYTKDTRFILGLTLHEAKAKFTREEGRLSVSDFLMETRGLIRVEGDFIVSNGYINGRFDVGVTEGVLRWVPGAKSQVFTEKRLPYLWTEMTLSGPLDSPKEDLTSRLIAAGITEVIETTADTAVDVTQGAVDVGKGVIDSAVDTGKEAINSLVPLFP